MNREVKHIKLPTSLLQVPKWVDVSENYEINPKGINGMAYIGKSHNGSSTGELRDLGKGMIACIKDELTRYFTIAWDEKELFFVDMQDVVDREEQRIDYNLGRKKDADGSQSCD